MSTTSFSPQQTIGIVINIPDQQATELTQLRLALGDERAKTMPPHITLLSPTETAVSVDKIKQHLERVAEETPAFHIEISGTDTFRPVSQVSFLTLQEGFAECSALHRRINAGVLATPLAFSYHPHLTIVQEVADAQHDAAERRLRDYSFLFQVNRFGLYVLDADSGWLLRGEFALL